MSKKIVILNSIKDITKCEKLCDGFILGIKNLSVNLPNYFSLEEVKENIKLLKNDNKDLFISLNKNMHNCDLDNLNYTLKELSTLNIDGIIFYDIAIINVCKKLNLNFNLIWNQEHLVTNYNTINYWQEKGVEFSYLSSELTLDEILEIRKNTTSKLMINVFGYIPMFTSKRPLVNNYLEKFDLKDESKINYLEKENNVYPIISKDLTTVYSSKILNLVREYPIFVDNNIEYLVFNSFNIEEDTFIDVLKLFNEEDNFKNFDKVNMLLDYKIDTGFLYKDTVYKVKKNG